ncbi:TPA: HNH endonuclease [Burkholderia vietnamiensis]|nr:HNH endonuclease [Burkholderia vietnamiensis]
MKRGYCWISIGGVQYAAHRLAWVYVHGDTLTQDLDVDHRNCDTAQNAMGNLRPATRSQNIANCRRWKGKKLPKGVSARRGRFVARIKVNRVSHWLGAFDSIDAAARAYAEASTRFFGQFGRTC